MTKPFIVLAAAIFLAACSGTSPDARPDDERFGHRYDGTAPDGRETHVISPPDEGEEYAIHPAVFDTVHIRPQLPSPGDTNGVKVELLIKGSFPDSCTELHEVEQERAGNIVNVDLDMRRPRNALCASVVRPYRFYVMLSGEYGEGNYTLKVNDAVRTFTIRPPQS